MRRSILVSSLLVLALAVPVAAVRAQGHEHGAMAAPASEKKANVQGEVLDMACFVAHNGQGPSHAACALKCLKDGQPMGLLAKDGTVYLLFADHGDATAYNKTKEFAGKNVEIQGELASKGSFKGITVNSVKPL
jgi:hypothetical protein